MESATRAGVKHDSNCREGRVELRLLGLERLLGQGQGLGWGLGLVS